MPLTKSKKHDHLLLQYSIISISYAILRKYSAKHASRLLRNRAAREAALSAAESIPREIGREVTMMLREVVMMVTESKRNVLLTEIF